MESFRLERREKKSEAGAPIFKTSLLGIRTELFPKYIKYRPFPLSGTRTIPLNQIASVEGGLAGLQEVTIETTGGKEYSLVIRLRDKDSFIEILQKVMTNT